jgi:hypothetical protein
MWSGLFPSFHSLLACLVAPRPLQAPDVSYGLRIIGRCLHLPNPEIQGNKTAGTDNKYIRPESSGFACHTNTLISPLLFALKIQVSGSSEIMITFYQIVRYHTLEGSSLVIAVKLQIQVKFESLYLFRLLMTDILVGDVAVPSRRSHETIQFHKRTKVVSVLSPLFNNALSTVYTRPLYC